MREAQIAIPKDGAQLASLKFRGKIDLGTTEFLKILTSVLTEFGRSRNEGLQLSLSQFLGFH
jgi:hypothetical protein